MPNLRIIYNNAADRATTLTASTTSGTLVAANMQSDIKGKVHRSTGLSVTYTLTWTNAETVGGIVLPCTNLSSAATIRVRLYSDTAGTTLISGGDSGTISAGGSLPILWDQTQPINANTFAYGGYTKAAVWFATQYTTVRRCVIDLVDTAANTAGYIDCSRLVIGQYWEPIFNAENGINAELVDTSQVTRSEAGDLIADRNIIHERLSFNFALLPESDRITLTRIIKMAGTAKNILVCLFPTDANTQQDFMIYGKRSNSSIVYDLFSFYKHSMEITGW